MSVQVRDPHSSPGPVIVHAAGLDPCFAQSSDKLPGPKDEVSALLQEHVVPLAH